MFPNTVNADITGPKRGGPAFGCEQHKVNRLNLAEPLRVGLKDCMVPSASTHNLTRYDFEPMTRWSRFRSLQDENVTVNHFKMKTL